jgi:CheY-like chemotaxis protein
MSGTIVIVEDNQEVCEILCNALQSISRKIQLVCFENCKEALAYLLKNHDTTCGVISDLMMSEMDGIDFLASLRKDSRTQDLPFLFLSGAEPSVFSSLLKGYAFSGFIPKPFETKVLKHLIEFNFRKVQPIEKAA